MLYWEQVTRTARARGDPHDLPARSTRLLTSARTDTCTDTEAHLVAGGVIYLPLAPLELGTCTRCKQSIRDVNKQLNGCSPCSHLVHASLEHTGHYQDYLINPKMWCRHGNYSIVAYFDHQAWWSK